MYSYNKDEIKDYLTLEDIFDLLEEWGGNPIFSNFGLTCTTICHNRPGEGSRKLYYYENSGLFHCFTGCEEPSFDIFELTIKIFSIQHNRNIDLNEAIRYISAKIGYFGEISTNFSEELLKEDWEILDRNSRIDRKVLKEQGEVILKEYNKAVLDNLNYKVKINPWLKEGISQEVILNNRIGFYPGGNQITIPHYDINDRFIGLRGRTICEADAELYGKYRPIKVNNQIYNHPLGFNLFNLNNSKNQIAIFKKAIVFESEKSTFKYQTYFGSENDISVACCGSHLSSYQIKLLKDIGVEEIIVAFDRQFEKIGDEQFKRLKKNLKNLGLKYGNLLKVTAMFDSKMITSYKASPIDEGKDKFLQLFKNRIIL